MLWDIKIQTDKVLEPRPDLVLIHKKSRICQIIDVACPFDTRVIEKEREKIDRYQDLKWEVKRIWKIKKVEVIPIVIGALGTVTKEFERWLNKVSPDIYFGTLQKACLLGTARTLR